MAYSNYRITGAVGISDIRNALGVSSGDIATLCSSQSINPMAKYKPVRHSSHGILTQAQRASTRYGFGSSFPTYTGRDIDPSNTWTYLRVRPRTDYSRYTDFDGYYHLACVPFAFNVSGALQDGIGIQLFANSSASDYYSDQGMTERWDVDGNLSLSELFANSSNASLNSYIAVCIHDMTKGDGIVVLTNKKIGDVGSTVPVIVLYAQEQTVGGVTYPSVAMLNDTTRSGNTFRFIIGLMNSAPSNPTTTAYQIFTDTTSPTASQLVLFSLAIKEGIDRKDLPMLSTHTIMGLDCSLSSSGMTLTYVGQVTKYGNTMLQYNLSGTISGTFITPRGHWSPEDGTVGVQITIGSDYGYVGDNYNMTYVTSAYVEMANTTYTQTLYTVSNVPVYIYQQVPTSERSAKVSAYAYKSYEKVYFDNTLTIRVTN